MEPITAIAASGLRARMESLDLVANNIANATTGGYKADREFYSLYVAPEAAGNDSLTTMPVIERPWVDHSQGVLHPTGNPLDVALSGKGFFTVNGPSGPLYTRNGNFRIAVDGKLTTSDGYPVRDSLGAPLTLQATRPLEISSDGTVTQEAWSPVNWRSSISPVPRASPSRAATISASTIRQCVPRPHPAPAWNRATWKPPIPGPPNPP